MFIRKENLGWSILSRNVTQLWREIELAMHDQEEISTRTTTKMISINTWACSKSRKNRITENVDFFESKDREIWPDLTGNQTPCRWRLPVTDFQFQEAWNFCLISIQNARKMCLVGLVETWTALSRKTEQPDPDLTGNQIPCRWRRALGWGEPGSDC